MITSSNEAEVGPEVRVVEEVGVKVGFKPDMALTPPTDCISLESASCGRCVPSFNNIFSRMDESKYECCFWSLVELVIKFFTWIIEDLKDL